MYLLMANTNGGVPIAIFQIPTMKHTPVVTLRRLLDMAAYAILEVDCGSILLSK